MTKKKPELFLLPGSKCMDATTLAEFFFRLTGKGSTAEEIEHLQRQRDADEPDRPVLTKRAPNAEASARSEAQGHGRGLAKSNLGTSPNPQPDDAAAREVSRSIESSKTRRSRR